MSLSKRKGRHASTYRAAARNAYMGRKDVGNTKPDERKAIIAARRAK